MSVSVLHREAPARDEFALTEREWQVMLLLACGFQGMEIGKRLFISCKTVSTYRDRILQKTGLSNNVEIALQARDQGLIKFENKKVVVCDPRALEFTRKAFHTDKKSHRADIPVSAELRA